MIKKRQAAADKIVQGKLTVREATDLIKKMAKDVPEKKKPKPGIQVDYVKEVERRLSEKTGRKISITSGRKKGRIEIEYYGADDFENLCQAIESLGSILEGKHE